MAYDEYHDDDLVMAGDGNLINIGDDPDDDEDMAAEFDRYCAQVSGELDDIQLEVFDEAVSGARNPQRLRKKLRRLKGRRGNLKDKYKAARRAGKKVRARRLAARIARTDELISQVQDKLGVKRGKGRKGKASAAPATQAEAGQSAGMDVGQYIGLPSGSWNVLAGKDTTTEERVAVFEFDASGGAIPVGAGTTDERTLETEPISFADLMLYGVLIQAQYGVQAGAMGEVFSPIVSVELTAISVKGSKPLIYDNNVLLIRPHTQLVGHAWILITGLRDQDDIDKTNTAEFSIRVRQQFGIPAGPILQIGVSVQAIVARRADIFVGKVVPSEDASVDDLFD